MHRPALYNHVDLRVRDRAEAIEFYGAFLPVLGLRLEDEGEWTSYIRGDDASQWFAFTEDRAVAPGPGRVSFAAETHDVVERASEAARAAGALAYEAPSIAYANCYASFFEDPSGNRLEICCAAT